MEKLLEDISSLIEQGEFHQAKDIVLNFEYSKLSREIIAPFCSLLRRLGLNHQVIDLLNPIIRPKVKKIIEPSDLELVEYAGALVRLGLTFEGFEILSRVNPKTTPRAFLISGFAYIAESDYVNANLVFNQYLKNKEKQDPYEVKIAKINILQGYTYLNEHYKAEKLIGELEKELDPRKNKLLYVSLLEFKAEIYRQQGCFKRAIELVNQAVTLLGESGTIDELLILKQKAVIIADCFGELKELKEVRKKAHEFKHVDTIRECDLFLSFFEENSELAKKLYWGTPYKCYRDRVLKLTAHLFKKDDFKEITIGGGRGEVIELNNLKGAKVNNVPHRIFKILIGDFYTGQSKLKIFNQLFPGEHYSPSHSANRVQQGLQRLKQIIKSENLPFKILETKGLFVLVPVRDFTLSLAVCKKHELFFMFDYKWFTVKDVEKKLGVSWRTAHRRVSKLMMENLLEAKGITVNRKFRFKK